MRRVATAFISFVAGTSHGSRAPYEKGGGVEDPRLVKIGGTYY